MKSEKELKKWLETLDGAYQKCSSQKDWDDYVEERTRIEIEIETLYKVLDIDYGTFEPLAEYELKDEYMSNTNWKNYNIDKGKFEETKED